MAVRSIGAYQNRKVATGSILRSDVGGYRRKCVTEVVFLCSCVDMRTFRNLSFLLSVTYAGLVPLLLSFSSQMWSSGLRRFFALQETIDESLSFVFFAPAQHHRFEYEAVLANASLRHRSSNIAYAPLPRARLKSPKQPCQKNERLFSHLSIFKIVFS